MSIGSDLLSSVTGATDKACIVVHDVRSQGTQVERELALNGGDGDGVTGGNSGPGSMQQQILTRTKDLLQGDASYAAAVSGGAGQDKTFFVQFNPASLQLDSSNAFSQKRDLSGTNDDQNTVNDTVTVPTVDLTVTLKFDKMNIYDAFMFDKVTSGVSSTTVTNIVTLGADLIFTVQPYVEGFISALRNPYTQSMTFQWADFSFRGRLRQLQAKYTMFSVSGHPIRADVQLRLRQDLRSTEMQKWKAQMETMLGQKDALQTFQQQAGNLLNLSG